MDIIKATDTLDALYARVRYPSTVGNTDVVVRRQLVEDAHDALLFALDEISQLRDDLSLAKHEVEALQDELSEAIGDDLVEEQRLDYLFAVR